MDRWRKVALAAFAANALLSLGFGLLYLISPVAMPYHQAAMKIPFAALGGGEQAVILALMRVAGGGFIAVAVATMFLLARPFRSGERWAARALLAIQLGVALPTAYAIATVIVRTEATPPWGASLVSVLLPVLGYAFAAVSPVSRPAVNRRRVVARRALAVSAVHGASTLTRGATPSRR